MQMRSAYDSNGAQQYGMDVRAHTECVRNVQVM
jgi:hypothetical protein